MIIGKGKFTSVNFDENSVTFSYKFVKFGKVNENVIKDISNELKEDFYGLKSSTVIMNDGEIQIVLRLSKKAAKEFYEKHPNEMFESDKPPFILNLEEQAEALSCICKRYL